MYMACPSPFPSPSPPHSPPPAFSREHSVRLETASLLKSVIQHQLISNAVVKLCVPEFLLRLTDTRGEIRAAYSTLLEVVPTCVITRWV